MSIVVTCQTSLHILSLIFIDGKIITFLFAYLLAVVLTPPHRHSVIIISINCHVDSSFGARLFIVVGAAVTTASAITSSVISCWLRHSSLTFVHPSWIIALPTAAPNVSIFLNIIISCTQNVTDSFLIQFITSCRVTTAASH